MATLEQLCRSGTLIRHEAILETWEMPERVILMTSDFDFWAQGTLQLAPKDRAKVLTPFEQLEEHFYKFIVGRTLVYPEDYRLLEEHRDGVYELKTHDVRIFGWFPRRRHFVAVKGALKSQLPNKGSYQPFIDIVLAVRASMDLDDPKTFKGKSIHDVI
jgi:hypothetical protein